MTDSLESWHEEKQSAWLYRELASCEADARIAELFRALAAAAEFQAGKWLANTPGITPEQPRSGEMVYINIHGGNCDAIFQTIGYPQIVQEGNTIRFVVSGEHVDDFDWCI